MSHLRTRAAIDEQYKWNPEAIFQDNKEWEQTADHVQARLRDLCTDNITSNAQKLVETLDVFFDISADFERLEVYASVRAWTDTTDERAQELTGHVDSLRATLQTVRSAIETTIQQTNPEQLKQMCAESDSLTQYEQYLHNLDRQAEHTADPAVEEAMSTLAPALDSNQTYQALLNADLSFSTIETPDGESIELTLNNREKQLRSQNREFRQTIHERFFDSLEEYRHTIASTFIQHAATAVRKAELRGYDSSLEAALASENVPVEVHETLTKTVTSTLGPLHEHLQYKRQRLDVDVLRPWDLNVRLVDDDPRIPYEKAKELLVDAVAPLGNEYQTRLADGLESRWIDVYETPDKISGAGTFPAHSTEPFILLNYQNDVNWLFGLAHEVGHAMHATLTNEAQPIVYGDFDCFISEVPSTLTEALLVYHILDITEDSALRRAVLDMWLERFRDLLYRRTRYAICEQQMHDHVGDGGQLTAHHLDQLIIDGWEAFNAPVEVDERVAGEWMHAKYLNMWMPFYVYQYATGFTAALSLVHEIYEEWDGETPSKAADRYLRFLRSGSSEYPLTLLTDAGVDLRSEQPYKQAIGAYHDALAEYRTEHHR